MKKVILVALTLVSMFVVLTSSSSFSYDMSDIRTITNSIIVETMTEN